MLTNYHSVAEFLNKTSKQNKQTNKTNKQHTQNKQNKQAPNSTTPAQSFCNRQSSRQLRLQVKLTTQSFPDFLGFLQPPAQLHQPSPQTLKLLQPSSQFPQPSPQPFFFLAASSACFFNQRGLSFFIQKASAFSPSHLSQPEEKLHLEHTPAPCLADWIFC